VAALEASVVKSKRSLGGRKPGSRYQMRRFGPRKSARKVR